MCLLLQQYCRWLFPCHHSFAWNCLFRLLSSAKSIMRQVRITLVCWRRLTPRPHHSATAYSVGHGPQRVPIFFGILVGTHKKSRPRKRNRRRRTPRPNGKKKKRQKKTLRIMSSHNVRTIHQWRRCRRRRRQDWRPLPKSRKQKCLKLLQKNSWNQWRVLAWPLRTTLLCCRNLRTLHQ